MESTTNSFTNWAGRDVNLTGLTARRTDMKLLLATPVLLFTLAGCTLIGGGGGDGSGSSDGDGSSGGEGSAELEGGSTACIIDKDWQLDVDDAAAKLLAYMRDNGGLNVISTTGEGSQGIYFDQEGYAGSATSLSYTIVVDMEDGLTMTMVQHHEGSPGGNWAWDGEDESTIVYEGWSGDYVVTTDTSINGTAAPTSTSPMGGGLDGQSMTVSCDGDTLTTQADGSPFTQVWHAN